MVDAQLITDYVAENFSEFGMNKRREVTRLLYEISKREQRDFKDVLAGWPDEGRSFTQLKKYLIKRRFPHLPERDTIHHLLPHLNIEPDNRVVIKKKLEIKPSHFMIEDSVKETALAKRLQSQFPQAQFTVIPTYKQHVGRRKFGIKDYNQRLETFYIIRENYDFYRRCPCSPKSVPCGYHVVNLGSGCAFECSYCYLQDYINSPGIVIPANIDDFLKHFSRYKQDIRLGSGELTDSLVFDHITGFSPMIVEFFKKYPKSTFEFKTKSDNVANLLTVRPGNNIVVSWSINPQKIIASTEFYTASLDERLDAAHRCIEAGYKVAFHFDPIIYYNRLEEDYQNLVHSIFKRLDHRRLAWFSLGTLRLTPRLKKIIENRFADNTILDEEFLASYDGKLRYGFAVRTNMYKKMQDWIRQHHKDVYCYLCMEEKEACTSCESAPLKPIGARR